MNPVFTGGTSGGDTSGGDTSGGGTDPSAIIPTWYGVQANILQTSCTFCHGGSSPFADLSWEVDQYNTIVTQVWTSPTAGMPEVVPDNPDGSYLIWKLRGQGPGGEAIQGVRMPAGSGPLDTALIDVIVQWISEGALLGVPSDADSGGSSTPTYPVGSWMYVWTESLQICTLCHSNTPSSPRCGDDFDCPPEGIVLTSDKYSEVVGDVVKPGNLDGSDLWEMVTESDADERMPLGLPALSTSQLDIIRDWILDGAPFCPDDEVCP